MSGIYVFAAYTYFYQGSNYWRFDNHRMEADKGYPRSILKDFMGCRGAPEPQPDTDPPPLNPSDRGQDERGDPSGGSTSEGGPTAKPAEDDEDKQVNVVVTVDDSDTKVTTLVMAIVPLVLILCILILIYAILRTLQNKEAPRTLVHCKRSLQDWV